MKTTRIGIIGDYNSEYALHPATTEAIQHAANALSQPVESEWLATDRPHDYADFQGLWCSPGSPYRSLEGALTGIRYARENGIPFLGTCGGFQHTVLEFGRNVIGLHDAAHAEYDPYASMLFVTRLSCSLVGKEMELQIKPGSEAARYYGCAKHTVEVNLPAGHALDGTADQHHPLRVKEAFYCNFGLNPVYGKAIEGAGLAITARDESSEARIVELPKHPFFLATLFVPQAKSIRQEPHSLIVAFCRAAMGVAVPQ